MSLTGRFEKAYLNFGEASSHGKTGVGKRFEFLFNPKEFSITKSASFNPQQTKTDTPAEYISTLPASITVEMFVDKSLTGTKKVPDYISELLHTMEPTEKSMASSPSPPYCSFGWGNQTYLSHAYVKSVATKYTLFDKDGTPLRAVCTVTLQEQRVPTKKTNPSSGSPESQVERIVRPGDSLASIAFEELGNPNLWRVIARANDVDDPTRLAYGSSLLIPSLTSLEAGSQN
jgi:nucleoid-associated protein YgaU